MNVQKKITHAFHVLDLSPWPFLSSLAITSVVISSVFYMHMFLNSGKFLIYSFCFLSFVVINWFLDIINEATFGGFHTKAVQQGLKLGFILFLVSELMFFFSFFWAYFHSSLNPSIFIGNLWPPMGILPISPYTVALLNTVILLSSGVFITWAHYSLLNKNRYEALFGLSFTILLGLLFTGIQFFEYMISVISINDGIFGSLLFLMTGFHGFHVIIGTCFLIFCLIRLFFYHFTDKHHLGFEFATWYWHFVDIIWIFLYISVYWWSWPASKLTF